MKQLFKKFFKEHKKRIVFFSALRIITILQALFWPYAFSKVINIISKNPDDWPQALLWVWLMIINQMTADLIRLRSKFGLDKISTRLKVALATFFSEETEVAENVKTGEAIHAIKLATDNVDNLMAFYRENALQLPVDLIVIPLILLKRQTVYFFILIFYVFLYATLDYLFARLYTKRLKTRFRAEEVFWGTTYRKTPEVWRHREDGLNFAQKANKEGEDLFRTTVAAADINYWRWIAVQTLSSASIGIALLFVLHKIVNGITPIGDLVLVVAYFEKTQASLNISTEAITQFIHIRTVLRRVNKAVRIKAV